MNPHGLASHHPAAQFGASQRVAPHRISSPDDATHRNNSFGNLPRVEPPRAELRRVASRRIATHRNATPTPWKVSPC
jgi:hypothetical protein